MPTSTFGNQVRESAETCPRCQEVVRPRVMSVKRGNQLVTEAHWVCGRCSDRFKIGTISVQDLDK